MTGGIFMLKIRLPGIPGAKEGDITGHDRATSEDESKGARDHEERRVSSKGIVRGTCADRS